MNLTRLVYYSQRNPSRDVDVTALVDACERSNEMHNLTGLLHTHDGVYVQVIEGGRVEVSELYARIARDPRHDRLILLSFGDAYERMFPDSAMALHQGMDEESRKVFLRYFATTDINPETVNVTTLLDALQDLPLEQPTKLTISI
ncbi:MAG: BLUF domain-containing protein [Litoreibacter sp.]|uniref:BLUF domain-containing protein n=1 Tax=Litoreibacter sp. TaxID=1969459 RepID=UPI003297EB34